MNRIVLDASVLIAILNEEPYEDGLLDVVEGAVMGAVNLSEVWTKIHEYGLTSAPRLKTVLALLDGSEPFTVSQARLAADLRLPTRPFGLSFGDRACLALGIELGAEVFTADRIWTRVDVGCIVHLIR